MARRKPLAVEIDDRLRKAGIMPDDPGLVLIRAWNRDVYALAAGSPLSESDRAKGYQR